MALANGLMDYDARMYDVGLGRFVQPDKLIQDEDNPQSWNRFTYVENNPILYTDPTGHVIPCNFNCGGDGSA
jgi:RHS repeat-associated protein